MNRESELGYCNNTPSVEECDDQDPCTRDERISQTACTFIPIEGCGIPETQPTSTVPDEPTPLEPTPEETPAPAIAEGPEYIFGSGCGLTATAPLNFLTWMFLSPVFAFWIARKK